MARRWLTLVGLLVAATVSAQPSARRVTNVAAILAHPGFYHLRPVEVVGTVSLLDTGILRVSTDGLSLPLVYDGSAPDGLDEIRGELWDVGRMNADDPRLARYDLERSFGFDPEGGWPRAGQVLAIVASAVLPAVAPTAPSIRNVVLNPSRYLDQRITLVGQFGGRNLLGDLPDAPAQSRYDFVLRSADAAVWVSNIRPRGKDFELSLDTRIDTGRWLEVSGILRQGRGLQWLDAEAGSLELTAAPQQEPRETEIRVPAAPPPEVIFSAPLAGETDVPLSSSVRIQFSRDLDPSSIEAHVRVAYVDARNEPASSADRSPVAFTTSYRPGLRVLEIEFPQPLDRLRTLKVDLGEGIVGTDKQPLVPWSVTFQTGS